MYIYIYISGSLVNSLPSFPQHMLIYSIFKGEHRFTRLIFFHQDALRNAFDAVRLLRCLLQMPQGLCDVLPLQPLLEGSVSRPRLVTQQIHNVRVVLTYGIQTNEASGGCHVVSPWNHGSLVVFIFIFCREAHMIAHVCDTSGGGIVLNPFTIFYKMARQAMVSNHAIFCILNLEDGFLLRHSILAQLVQGFA